MSQRVTLKPGETLIVECADAKPFTVVSVPPPKSDAAPEGYVSKQRIKDVLDPLLRTALNGLKLNSNAKHRAAGKSEVLKHLMRVLLEEVVDEKKE